nr:3-phosphoshikimate 1-carboxyvinyltransferase [Geomicrobium sediminis]
MRRVSVEQNQTDVRSLSGTITVPGDKSISHRAVMFGSIAKGTTTIRGFLMGEDCLSTIRCFRQLGVRIEHVGDEIIVHGKGIDGLKEPSEVLDVGNSGTTIRLMLGILSGLSFYQTVIGDESIAKRPMKRVTKPLRSMGATIDGRDEANLTPLSVRGGNLTGITHTSPVASAQVKSSILLAGLQAKGVTTVLEPHRSRDHTERMLQAFGVNLLITETGVSIEGGQSLQGGGVVNVPGDISSAAFPLVATAIVPNSEVKIQNVGINPTRAGILDVLKKMGAQLTVSNEREQSGEPVADLTIQYKKLNATTIDGELIPRLIDEIPVLAVLATQAEGKTVIKDAEELKYKETNRIDTVVDQLVKMGADITSTNDGMVINGPTPLYAATVDSFGDHRIGMAFAIANLIAEGETTILRKEAVAVSYPNFFDMLKDLSR